MKIYISVLILSLSLCSLTSHAQYRFTIDKQLSCTPVKNQQRTGTCWSYATSSFLESEILKVNDVDIDFSEMYVVRKIYEDKAQNYMLRQGKANFSQGSLSHDLVRVASTHGMLPQAAYDGKPNGEEMHDHSELENGIKGYLDGVIATKRKGNNWRRGVNALLDIYLGPVPEEFEWNKKKYSPTSFNAEMELKIEDYISLTSFSHHPYYEEFVLEIPDNYSNGAYYNMPINELMEVIDYAVMDGYSIAWDGDVSEKGFSAKEGIAVLPEEPGREDVFKKIGAEMNVTQESRQIEFENFNSTDDHLMHIVGISFDQKGNKYYLVKNSWGKISPHKGYIHMSEAYVKMKTISVMVNKGALPDHAAKKLLSAVNVKN